MVDACQRRVNSGPRWLFYRLAVVLPARAVDDPITLPEAWGATADYSFPIVMLGLVLAVAQLFPGLAAPLFVGVVGQILGNVITWFMMLIGVSILTTLYGLTIEERELV